MRHARIAALLLLPLALAGCAETLQMIGAPLEKPRLLFQGWEPRELDLEGATIDLKWRVENPNAVGLKLAGLDYRLELQGRVAVTGAAAGGLRLPARGAAPLELPVRVRFADVQGIVEAIASHETLAWRASGDVGVDTGMGVLKIPFSVEGKVPSPRLPRITLAGLAVHGISLSGLTVDVKLEVANPNAFPLPLGTLRYGLRLGGSEVANAASLALAPVGGGQRVGVTVPVRLTFAAAGEAARRAVAGEPLDVALRGQAGFGSMGLPLDLAGRLTPGR